MGGAAKSGRALEPPDGVDDRGGLLEQRPVGSGWTILPPLAVIKAMTRGGAIRALPFPGKPIRRTVNVVSLKNERLDIAQQIRGAAVEALKEHFLPPLRKLLPAAAVAYHPSRRRQIASFDWTTTNFCQVDIKSSSPICHDA